MKNLNERVTRIEEILPTLATRDDMREEGERTRRHFDVVAERLETQIRVIAEGHMSLHAQLTDFRSEVKRDFAGLDRRLMRLEASR